MNKQRSIGLDCDFGKIQFRVVLDWVEDTFWRLVSTEVQFEESLELRTLYR